MEELKRTPLEFGEARYYRMDSRFLYRWASVGPIFVEFAVLEVEKIVYIRRFGLMNQVKE